MNKFLVLGLCLSGLLLAGCDDINQIQPTANQKEAASQEKIQQESVRETGMPAIHNFFEKKLLKQIYELRDQAHYNTYAYTYNEMTGKPVFFCNSIGYGIPYATQYTSPTRVATEEESHYSDDITLPQPDPNGLYSPADAEGTWIVCQDPANPSSIAPIYVEPRLIVSPFKLTT